MYFDINPSAAVPMYRQIIDQVKRMVMTGSLLLCLLVSLLLLILPR